MNELIKILEDIKRYQMNHTQSAKTTEVYQLAEKAIQQVKLLNLHSVTNCVFVVKNTCGDWISLHNNKEDAEKIASNKNTRPGELLGFFVDEEEVL